MLTKSIKESKTDNANSNLAIHKQAFYSIAKCIAVLTVNNKNDGQSIMQGFINDIRVCSVKIFVVN
jgi:hypothetical protein